MKSFNFVSLVMVWISKGYNPLEVVTFDEQERGKVTIAVTDYCTWDDEAHTWDNTFGSLYEAKQGLKALIEQWETWSNDYHSRPGSGLQDTEGYEQSIKEHFGE